MADQVGKVAGNRVETQVSSQAGSSPAQSDKLRRDRIENVPSAGTPTLTEERQDCVEDIPDVGTPTYSPTRGCLPNSRIATLYRYHGSNPGQHCEALNHIVVGRLHTDDWCAPDTCGSR